MKAFSHIYVEPKDGKWIVTDEKGTLLATFDRMEDARDYVQIRFPRSVTVRAGK